MRLHLPAMRALFLALAVSFTGGGCDAADSRSEDKGDDEKAEEAKAEEKEDKKDEKPKEAEDAKQPASDDAASESLSGTVTFSVDGETKSFEHIPKDSAVLTTVTTNFIAKPDADSQEEFSVNLVHFDPRKAELPMTLKLDLKKQMQSKDPMAAAQAPKPLVAYQKADGTRYGGYVTIKLESWKDDRLTGTVEDIDLPPAKRKQGGPIKLSDVKFSVKLR